LELDHADQRARSSDRVTVNPSTGRAFELPVTTLVEQYIGMGAYMELGALRRLSDAGSVVTGADVKLAAGDPSAFHHALKESPIVAGFVPHAATVTAFRETMARTLTIIVSAFVAFAAIPAQIVDATVRARLVERLRESRSYAPGLRRGHDPVHARGELGVAVVLTYLWEPSSAPAGPGDRLGLDNDLFHVPLVVG
jgi:putative ABC transport system permease protein